MGRRAMPMYFIKSCALVMFVIKVAYGQVTLTSNSTYQAENSSLQLKCTVQPPGEDYAKWKRRSYGATLEKVILLTGISGTDQCTYEPTLPLPSYMVCSCRSREYSCIIKDLTRDQDGDQWNCFSTYTNGQEVGGSYVTIQISIPISSVTISPSSDTVRVAENSTQTFICTTAWGKPAATVTWFKLSGTSEVAITSGIQSTQSTHQDRTIQMTSTLTYTASRADNSYRVFCRATNGGDTVQSTSRLQLDILYPPTDGPVIQGLPGADVYKMIRGSSTQQRLTCSVTGGYPLPTLSWNCYGGTHNGSTQGNTVTRTVYWTAGVNVDSTCTCTAQQSETTWTRTKSVPVTVLYVPSSPSCRVGSATVTSGIIRVISGRTFNISCNSDASPSPAYTWTLPAGGTVNNAGLSVSSVKTGDTYSLSVHNTMEPTIGDRETGRASTTFSIDLLVHPSAPVFYYGTSSSGTVINNNHLDVIKGTQFSVDCVSTGNPAPTYTWNGPSQTWSTTAQTNLTQTCSVVNTLNPTGYNPEAGTRQETKLTVRVMFPPGVIECTVGSSRFTAGHVYVIQDTTFNIRCDSTSFPAPYNYTWTLPDGGTRTGPGLRVENIQSVQTNQYRVTVNNSMVPSVGETKTGSNSTILDIQLLYPPRIQSGIRIQGNSSTSRVNDSFISTVENSTFTLSFDVTPGYPTATTYTWSRRSEGTSISNQDKTFTNIKRAEADFYNFTAVNQMNPTGFGMETGTASNNVYINVKYRSTITAFNANSAQWNTTVEASEGSPLKLTCVTESNPLPRITLTRNGAMLQESTSGKQMEYNKPNSSCEYDMGEYSCLSQNELNPSAEKRTLHYYVLCKPRLSPFIQHIANVSGSLRSSANISVTMVAYPAPTYTWQILHDSGWKDVTASARISIKTSDDRLQSNVSISDIQEADFGSYRVVAKNSQGEIPILLYFQASYKPFPPTNFMVMGDSVTETSANVTWKAGLNGGLPQTFKLQLRKKGASEWTMHNIKDMSTLYNGYMHFEVNGLQSGSEYELELFASNYKGNSSSVLAEFTTIKHIDKDATASSSNAGVIAGSIVGGLIGLLAIVMTVIALRKYELIGKCVRKPESTGKALNETSAVSTLNNAEYESLGHRDNIRRNQPNINSSGNDNELGTNAYDSLDAHQSNKHVYSELGRQPRTDQTRLYENTAVKLDSGTAVYVNTTFENA